MIKFSIQQDKGGCGKTSLAINLSYGLAKKGYKVLLIDNDPQANATSNVLKVSKALDEKAMKNIIEQYDSFSGDNNLMVAKNAIHTYVSKKTFDYELYDAYLNPENTKKAIVKTSYENLWILPSTHKLSELDFQLKAAPFNRDGKLRDILDSVKEEFDVAIIDNSPFVNALTFNAMYACYEEGDQIIIPITIDQFGIEGLDYTMETLFNGLSYAPFPVNYDLKIVIGMTKRTKVCKEGIETIKHIFGDKVFDTTLRFQDKPVGTSFLKKKILFEAYPKEGITNDFQKLIDEVETRIIKKQ